MIQLLLESGADVNIVDDFIERLYESGETPLHFAVALNENPEVVRLLLESGADVNAGEEYPGRTPLHKAFVNENPEVIHQVVRLLLENGADLNASVGIDFPTPWMRAASRNTPEIVRLFLDNGADVNTTDEYYGYTPLYRAAKHNENPEVITLLIESGADIHAVSDQGTACDVVGTRHRRIRDPIEPLPAHIMQQLCPWTLHHCMIWVIQCLRLFEVAQNSSHT